MLLLIDFMPARRHAASRLISWMPLLMPLLAYAEGHTLFAIADIPALPPLCHAFAIDAADCHTMPLITLRALLMLLRRFDATFADACRFAAIMIDY